MQINATPVAISSSHPPPSTWYPSANPFFEWSLPNGAENYRGVYFVLDQFGDTVPDETATWLDVSQMQILLSGIAPGVRMFHIVSVDHQGYRTPGVGTAFGRVRSSVGDELSGATVTLNRGLPRPTQTR